MTPGIVSSQLLMASRLPPAVNPDFADVQLLLPMTGADGSTSFFDASNNNHTVTPSGAVHIESDQTLFGGNVAKFATAAKGTHTPGDYLVVPAAVAAAMAAGPFCVEFFSRRAPSWGAAFAQNSSGGSSEQAIRLVGDGRLLFFRSSNFPGPAVSLESASGLADPDVWFHFALTWDGDGDQRLRIFKDGLLAAVSSPNAEGWIGTGNPVYIGRIHNPSAPQYTEGYIGYLAQFRITCGNPVYLSDFAVPTGPFPQS